MFLSFFPQSGGFSTIFRIATLWRLYIQIYRRSINCPSSATETVLHYLRISSRQREDRQALQSTYGFFLSEVIFGLRINPTQSAICYTNQYDDSIIENYPRHSYSSEPDRRTGLVCSAPYFYYKYVHGTTATLRSPAKNNNTGKRYRLGPGSDTMEIGTAAAAAFQ